MSVTARNVEKWRKMEGSFEAGRPNPVELPVIKCGR
jgi:hypothetical protein